MEEEDVVAAANGHLPGTEDTTISAEERTGLNVAFQLIEDAKVNATLRQQTEASRASFFTWQHELTPEVQKHLRENTQFVVPVFREGERLHAVLRHLREEHEVPAENVTLVESSVYSEPHSFRPLKGEFGSKERSEYEKGMAQRHISIEIAKRYGVTPIIQNDVLGALVHADKFADLLQTNALPRGKGLTLTTGYLHLLATGKIHPGNRDKMYVTSLDSDSQHYSIGHERLYDPAGYAAYAQITYGAETVKAAKTRRDNQPIHVANNALAPRGAHANRIMDYIGRMQWPLTGEMSRTARTLHKLLLSTGYPVEMVMNVSDAENQLKFMQYADGPNRGDGANSHEKETVMYSLIARTLSMITEYQLRQVRAALRQALPYLSEEQIEDEALLGDLEYKNVIDFETKDIREVNRLLSKSRRPNDLGQRTRANLYIAHEKDAVPQEAPIVTDVDESRLIGTPEILSKGGILAEKIQF